MISMATRGVISPRVGGLTAVVGLQATVTSVGVIIGTVIPVMNLLGTIEN